MALGTNDAPVNCANGAYMMTNSTDVRAEERNSDHSIGSFMASISFAIQGAETNGLHFDEAAKRRSPSESAVSLLDIRYGRTVRHIAMQDRYAAGPPS